MVSWCWTFGRYNDRFVAFAPNVSLEYKNPLINGVPLVQPMHRGVDPPDRATLIYLCFNPFAIFSYFFLLLNSDSALQDKVNPSR